MQMLQSAAVQKSILIGPYLIAMPNHGLANASVYLVVIGPLATKNLSKSEWKLKAKSLKSF
jgi:hypothetical protein